MAALLGGGLLAMGIGAIVGAFTKHNQARATNTLTIDTSSAFSYAQSTIQSSSQSIGQTNSNANRLTLVISGNVVTDVFRVQQTIDATTQANAQLDASVLSKMNVELINQLNASISQASNAQAGGGGILSFLNGSRAADANNQQTFRNAINQAVSKYTQQTNYQSIVNSVYNTNDSTITVSGNITARDFSLNQNIVSTVVTKALLTAIIDEANNVLSSNNTDLQLNQNAGASTASDPSKWIWPLVLSTIISFISCIMLMLVIFAVRKSKQK